MVRSRAPGKLVLLGEYAVLDGAPALVVAVNRYCKAKIVAAKPPCRLTTQMVGVEQFSFAPGESSGVALVDLVRRSWPQPSGWSASLDSSEFFAQGSKLGLGSSAAALVAWAGAWEAYRHPGGFKPDLTALIELHRVFQNGAGSGLDVAAALIGGVVSYRLDAAGMPHIGSVRLPNSVAFAGVFAGQSAATPGLINRYRSWAEERPGVAAELKQTMGKVAELGLAALREDDVKAFSSALRDYGRCLDDLGRAMGAEVWTAEHRAIEAEADRCGLVYKVSGAGGGDTGVAFARDPEALALFASTISARGYLVVELNVDQQGLVVEERSQ